MKWINWVHHMTKVRSHFVERLKVVTINSFLTKWENVEFHTKLVCTFRKNARKIIIFFHKISHFSTSKILCARDISQWTLSIKNLNFVLYPDHLLEMSLKKYKLAIFNETEHFKLFPNILMWFVYAKMITWHLMKISSEILNYQSNDGL